MLMRRRLRHLSLRHRTAARPRRQRRGEMVVDVQWLQWLRDVPGHALSRHGMTEARDADEHELLETDEVDEVGWSMYNHANCRIDSITCLFTRSVLF
jgi:hypothetical protein